MARNKTHFYDDASLTTLCGRKGGSEIARTRSVWSVTCRICLQHLYRAVRYQLDKQQSR